MYTNPNLLDQLVKDHQRQLLREAELERQVIQARSGQPTLSMRMRLRLSALLLAMSRSVRPHSASQARKARLTRSLA